MLSLYSMIQSATNTRLVQAAQYEALCVSLDSLIIEQLDSTQWFWENEEENLALMKILLGDLTEDGYYTGPRMFENGMVVELADGQVIYPSEMPAGYVELSEEMVTKEIVGNGEIPSTTVHPQGGEETQVLVCGVPLQENVYYVDLIKNKSLEDYIEAHSRVQDIMDLAVSAYGGSLFLISKEEGKEDWTLNYYTDPNVNPDDTSLIRQLEQVSDSFNDVITIGDEKYYAKSQEISGNNRLVLLASDSSMEGAWTLVVAVLLLVMLLIAILLIVYLVSAGRYVRSGDHEKAEKDRYRPSLLRKKVVRAGVVGVIVIFAGTCFLYAVGSLQQETNIGQERMNRMQKVLAQKEEQASSKAAKAEEDWYVSYGKQMAQVLARYPQLATRKKLQDLCNAIQLDYIMLFDQQGKEIACNKDYSGFVLGTGQGENSEDFLRLQQGVESVVHPASEDPVTQQKEQMIGVSMPGSSSSSYHNVLMMALPPELTQRSKGNYDEMSNLAFLFSLSKDGNLYFTADKESGVVLQSSEYVLEGMTTEMLGLSSEGTINDYMGIIPILNTRYYVIGHISENGVLYYAVPLSTILKGLIPFSLICTGCFLFMYLVLSLIYLVGYTEKKYQELVPAGEPEAEGAEQEIRIEPVKERKIFQVRWRDKKPEERVRLLFTIMVFLLIAMLGIYILLNMANMRQSGSSLLGFILFGNWTKGLNLFSLTAILLTIAGLYLTVVIAKAILRLLTGFLGNRAETICRLLHSFVHYIAVLVGLYFTLEYLGFDLRTILAGLGIVGLALSFGARDMIADIFAGISIVFEDSFQVGEIIQVGKFQGRVKSIGIRLTKIVGFDNSIIIINNKEIRDVVNLSRMSSTVEVAIKIPVSQSMKHVREILEQELPAIGEKTDLIIGTPQILEFSEIGERSFTIKIGADCQEKDAIIVRSTLNEEAMEILKREGIL